MGSPSIAARRRLSSFQRLAIATTATTYLLILVGGLVRASGAGLGCPDWPRCFGSWIPPMSAAELPAQFDASQFNPRLMWTEYLNRLLGVTVGLLIFATLVSAIRHHRHVRRILWSTAAAFLLVGFEGWLGGVVVAHELAAWIVTAHLIVALIIVSLLLYATVYAFFVDQDLQPRPRADLAWLTVGVIALTVLQVGYGAQVRGGIDDAIDAGTPRSRAVAAVAALAVTHRDLGFAVTGGAIALLILVAIRYPAPGPLTRVAFAILGLTVVQTIMGLALGANLIPALQVLHLVTASLLLGAETLLLLLARWLPARATDLSVE